MRKSLSLQTIISRAARLIYPSRCSLCNDIVADTGGLCTSCWSDITFCTGTLCHRCGTPVDYMALSEDPTHILCESCHRFPHPWQMGRAVMAYDQSGRDIILSLKHADRTDLVPLCGQWMLHALQDITQDATTTLVPVPLHWTRTLKRKYNQALELARYLAKHTDLQLDPSIVKRTQRTKSQGHAKREARHANVRDAFKACQSVKGRHIILIDDVMTTGATLDACTLTLLDAGARRVDVLVLARVNQDFLQDKQIQENAIT